MKSTSKNEKELKDELIKISSSNPEKWYTFSAIFGEVEIHEYSNKPNRNDHDTEQTYRLFNGFFNNGKIVKPSKTFIHRYEFIPER